MDIKALLIEAADNIDDGICDPLIAKSLRAASEAMGEPVLICRDRGHVNWWLRTGEQCTCTKVRPGVELYLAPPAPAVSEGWRENTARLLALLDLQDQADMAGEYEDAAGFSHQADDVRAKLKAIMSGQRPGAGEG